MGLSKKTSRLEGIEARNKGMYEAEERNNDSLSMFDSTRAKRPIETSSTVHVLSVFRLLLLPNTIDIVARYLGVFRGSEFRESHAFAHQRIHIIFILSTRIHIHFIAGTACELGASRAILLTPIVLPLASALPFNASWRGLRISVAVSNGGSGTVTAPVTFGRS